MELFIGRVFRRHHPVIQLSKGYCVEDRTDGGEIPPPHHRHTFGFGVKRPHTLEELDAAGIVVA